MKLKLSFRRKKKTDDEDNVMPEEDAPEKSSISVKSSGGGAKQWLFLHCEKLVMVSVVVLIGLFVYGAINKLTLKKNQSPIDLEGHASTINDNIARSPFSQSRYPVPNFPARVEDARRTVGFGEYTFRSIVGETQAANRKRSEPRFLPPQDIESTTGYGVFWVGQPSALAGGITVGMKNEVTVPYPKGFSQGGVPKPPGAKTEGRRWVVITARVPANQQAINYQTNFTGAPGYDPKRDVPRYVGAQLQRLEVGAGEPLNWEKSKTWTVAEWNQLQNQQRRTWSTEVAATEVVRPEYIESVLVDPLGPLAYKSWRPWASHSTFPLLPLKQRVTVRRDPRGRPILGQNARGRPTAPAPGRRQAAPPPVADAEFRLLRMIDFTVEPGKRYRYRAQLVLWNPNTPELWEEMETKAVEDPVETAAAGGGPDEAAAVVRRPAIASRFMEDPERMKSSARRASAWSQPTAEIQVPGDAQLFAGSIRQPTEDVLRESAIVVVQVLEVASGRMPIGSLSLHRGSMVEGATDLYRKVAATGQLGIGKGFVRTGTLLLDMRGGAGTAPSQLLLLDAQGNLFSRDSASNRGVVNPFLKLKMGAEEERKKAEEANKRVPADETEEERRNRLLRGG